LVTGFGALPFSSRKKPQLINTISRSPSGARRAIGATCLGNIPDDASNDAARLCETRKNRASMSRFLFSE
jgi:hypothetical protein